MKALYLPLTPRKLDLPSEALAHVIIALYRESWPLVKIRAEARRLHCERTHCKERHELLRWIAEARLAAL